MRNSSDGSRVSSLAKGVAILSCFSPYRPSLALGELASFTGLPKTTTHRLIRSLCDVGVLDQSENDGAYRLGTKLIELGDAARLSLPIYRNAEPILQDLAQETGLVAFLVVPDDGEALYVARARIPAEARAMHGHLPVGGRLPLTVGAGPIAILAFLEESTVERALAQPLTALTPFTVVEPQLIRKRLTEIRELGYALSWRDVNPDMAGVGAPIFDEKHRPVGAISVGGPFEEWSDERVSSVSKQVMRAASRVSWTLGHVDDRFAAIPF